MKIFQFFDKAHGLEVLVKGGGGGHSHRLHSFVSDRGQSEVKGDILGVVKQSTCKYGSGKVGEEAPQLCIFGQGGYWGKVKRSTLKFVGQNS